MDFFLVPTGIGHHAGCHPQHCLIPHFPSLSLIVLFFWPWLRRTKLGRFFMWIHWSRYWWNIDVWFIFYSLIYVSPKVKTLKSWYVFFCNVEFGRVLRRVLLIWFWHFLLKVKYISLWLILTFSPLRKLNIQTLILFLVLVLNFNFFVPLVLLYYIII